MKGLFLMTPLLPLAAVSIMSAQATAQSFVNESERQIPIAYDVDVVVVGGTSGAVAAAVEAAGQGAKVFLAAPRPYLGEDVCGAYRLWLEPGEEPVSELAKRMFEEPPAPLWVGEGLPFTYEADPASADRHKDTDPPSLLADGKWASAFNQSVEYGGDVTVTVDLGEPKAIGQVHVMAFQRVREAEIDSIVVSMSDDKTSWREAAVIKNELAGQGDYVDSAIALSAPVTGTARYLRFLARKTEPAGRVLLGEIVIEPPGQSGEVPEGARTPPMPMQVKRVLDQALIDADVQFLFGCAVTDVLRDAGGRIAGIVMANRSGRQAVRARVIIDATERATVARLAGAEFEPYPAGPQVFQRIVVGGHARQGDGVAVREMPTPVQIDRSGQSLASFRKAFEYTLTIPMKDGSCASFAEAEQIARDRTWDPEQVGSADELFQIPPDPMRGVKRMKGPWRGADDAELGAFRPRGCDGLYVLGGCADVSREAAAQLLRPLELMEAGARIGRAAAKDAHAGPEPRIVCFGDSITAGYYPAKLERLLDGFDVINAGVGGCTSGEGLARLDEDVLRYKPAAVVILFGANDSILTGPKEFRTPVDAYEANLRAMIERCTAHGASVVLCTVLPMISEPYFERHPKEYYEPEGGLDAILGRYRAAALRVAESMDVPALDLYGLLKDDLSVLGECGVHPNAKGERRLAALVADALRPLLPERAAEPAQPPSVRVAAAKPASSAPAGDVAEFLTGLRPIEEVVRAVPSPARSVPVLGEYDVVVIGGGTGGAPAGIGAARDGAKTLVVEYLHGLGGVGTLGLIGKYYYGFREGFTAQIDAGVAGMGTEDARRAGTWNVEWKMEWFRQELRKSGADIWFGALGCGAFVEDGCVKGVVVATPAGRGVVLAKAVIDSTGNSDVAAAAGAQCTYTDGSHVAVQGTGLPPRTPGTGYTNTDYTLTDETDMVDQWRTLVAAKNRFENGYDLAQIIDSRERRRIVGDFVISPLDIYNGRTYPDTVVYSSSNFDTHGYTVHPLFALKAPDKKAVGADTPYRSLLPKGLDGILVTGLGISAHRDAMPILRMQPDIQNQGYGVGLAASMAAKQGQGTRAIDLKALQRHLVSIGNLPERVLTDEDSFPVPVDTVKDAVARMANDYDGLGIVLMQPDDALPLLRAAYAAAESDDAKLIYAHTLGMLGDATGASTLIDAVASAEWDAGWSFTGGGQFGASISPLDSLIIALAHTRDERALAPIVAKVAKLGPESEFSHHRAVAMALETLADPAGARPLADLLRKHGMMGYAYTAIEDAQRGAQIPDQNTPRDRSLRELILARALFRCGDYEGLGEAVLKEYEQDLRGHHARHAHAVLKGNGRAVRGNP
ncbi:MAG: FAD-dependent oxidoreductase [Candidatus Hydrogenedentes bacterium]|nr:FAD-dependent oxidoreductase [Candidatus Hydrogenedentota bacterium]